MGRKRSTEDNPVAGLVALLAFVLLLVGGLVVALSSSGGIPGAVGLAGGLAFLTGGLLVGVVAHREARRTGRGRLAAVWDAVRAGVGTLAQMV